MARPWWPPAAPSPRWSTRGAAIPSPSATTPTFSPASAWGGGRRGEAGHRRHADGGLPGAGPGGAHRQGGGGGAAAAADPDPRALQGDRLRRGGPGPGGGGGAEDRRHQAARGHRAQLLDAGVSALSSPLLLTRYAGSIKALPGIPAGPFC